MSSDLVTIRRALVSVFDKSNLPQFGQSLARFGVDILATDSTHRALREAGLNARSVQDDMKLPTALSGRVKTLHAPLLAAILARNTREHLSELESMGIGPIDMVVCNFYPFSEVLRAGGFTDQKLVENIDIGGPTMVRAASKNFERVTVVSSPGTYDQVINEMSRTGGATTLEFRRMLAIQAFSLTSSYDSAIFNGLRRETEVFPSKMVIAASKFTDAKYGENPDRKAVVYSIDGWTNMTDWKQLAGESLSFNNYLDVGSAFDIVEGYDGTTAVATVKHGQISGFAFASSVAEAYSLAHACDPEADFGGTVIASAEVDVDAARLIGKNKNEGHEDRSVYTEIVIAPGFSSEALRILKEKQKKKIRIIKTTSRPNYPYDLKVVEGAILAQDALDYRIKLDASKITVPTKVKPDGSTLQKLLAAWEIVRKVQSNGIVVADGSFEDQKLTRFWTLGVASFRKRNGAVKIALDNAGSRARGAVCASDGFFPFRDSLDLLGAARISAVIQPGGSANDQESVEAADRYGIAMALTHTRAFKH